MAGESATSDENVSVETDENEGIQMNNAKIMSNRTIEQNYIFSPRSFVGLGFSLDIGVYDGAAPR